FVIAVSYARQQAYDTAMTNYNRRYEDDECYVAVIVCHCRVVRLLACVECVYLFLLSGCWAIFAYGTHDGKCLWRRRFLVEHRYTKPDKNSQKNTYEKHVHIADHRTCPLFIDMRTLLVCTCAAGYQYVSLQVALFLVLHCGISHRRPCLCAVT